MSEETYSTENSQAKPHTRITVSQDLPVMAEKENRITKDRLRGQIFYRFVVVVNLSFNNGPVKSADGKYVFFKCSQICSWQKGIILVGESFDGSRLKIYILCYIKKETFNYLLHF